MSHSSQHPCCWCNVDKGNLSARGITWTVANMMDLFWDYFDGRADKKNAKDFGNVIHPNMFVGGTVDESAPIILLVPPPELHLLMGPVNTLYVQLLKISPDCERWSKHLHLKREDYHGGLFNGNDCRKLLKNVSILEEIAPPKSVEFVTTFKAFNKVVEACYGRYLSPNFKEMIEHFRKCFIKLNIAITPKVHAVFYHIAEFCEKKNMGLAPWSEQTAESLHHDFKTIWENFKVRDISHPEYGERLLKAIVNICKLLLFM